MTSIALMGYGLVALFVLLGVVAICVPRFRKKDVRAELEKKRR